MAMVDLGHSSWPVTVAILAEMTAAGVDLDAAAVSIAVKVSMLRWSQAERAKPPLTSAAYQPQLHSGQIVYYVRRGDLVKIGTTSDPAGRFGALLPDEILAFEPGAQREEAQRHRQFDHLRPSSRTEYFTAAPELLAHIRAMRTAHGEPDPAWPTMANRPTRPSADYLPSPMITASDAAKQFGIKPERVRAWASRGRLHAVGVSQQGQKLYLTGHIEHLLDLR